MTDLAAEFGAIDIYLFDQILRGRVPPGSRILDAGCGGGRNLVYFLNQGYPVFGVDRDPDAVSAVRALASRLPGENFAVAPIESLPFDDASFDLVVSNAVLHFARDDEHFSAMVDEMWRVLAPGGLFFSRLASSIGMEGRFTPLGGARFRLLDGSERYLVDEARLVDLTSRLRGQLADPLKTTVVQNQRCMTTWVVRKSASNYES